MTKYVTINIHRESDVYYYLHSCVAGPTMNDALIWNWNGRDRSEIGPTNAQSVGKTIFDRAQNEDVREKFKVLCSMTRWKEKYMIDTKISSIIL